MRTSRRPRWLFLWLLCCAPLVAGCHLFPHQADTKTERTAKDAADGTPGKYSMRVPNSNFIFLSDIELRRDQPLFQDLSKLREQVSRELNLPYSNKEVFVYLFEDKARYEKFIQSKNLPERRAFFVAQPRRLGGDEDLMVYTYLGERIQQDLRHELTHALLHSVLKSVPIWLDEGLAEYFEVPSGKGGVNPQHLEALRQPNVRFDMDRLEKLEEVQQMRPEEYRESWAWVHLMLRTTPQAKEKLLAYLQELRVNPNPSPLRPRLAPTPLPLEQAMQAHLADMERKLPKNATALK